MEYVELITALWMLFWAAIMNARSNISSVLVFKVVPFVLGMLLLFDAVTRAGFL